MFSMRGPPESTQGCTIFQLSPPEQDDTLTAPRRFPRAKVFPGFSSPRVPLRLAKFPDAASHARRQQRARRTPAPPLPPRPPQERRPGRLRAAARRRPPTGTPAAASDARGCHAGRLRRAVPLPRPAAVRPPSLDRAALYRWVCAQRHEWRRGKLPDADFRALSALPAFAWDRHDDAWKAHFFALAAYRDAHGHTCVPLVPRDPHERLARWVAKQRHLAKRGLLADDRRRRLAGLGFAFAPGDERFAARLQQLRALAETYGHSNVPPSWPDDPSLARWAEDARRRWRRGRLTIRHQRALLGAGFSVAPGPDAAWDAHHAALARYAALHRRRLPSFIDDPPLHQWLARQGRAAAAGALPPERMAKLRRLGADFRPWKHVFRDRFDALRAFFDENGHCRVPPGGELELWACQLRARGRSRLSKANQRELDTIGFVWQDAGEHRAAPAAPAGRRRQCAARAAAKRAGRIAFTGPEAAQL
jgi:Helicase associated domain